jgi:hypothetical protein
MSNPGESTGPLSIEQAVAAMELPKKEPSARENLGLGSEAPAEAAPAQEQTETAAEPTAESAAEAETQEDGEKTEATETEAEEAEQPAVEPPKFWDADAKERFKALPPDVQKIIVQKEDERNTATARALQLSKEQQKAYEANASKLQQLTAGLDKQIPLALDSLKYHRDQYTQKWANVDWNAVVDQYGADQALKLKNQHDSELNWLNDQSSRIQQLQAVKDQADQEAQAKFVAEETSKLAQYAPELTDPKQGQERREKLGQFLAKIIQDEGGDLSVLNKIPAWQAAIAYDAMKWRNGQATAKALVNAKPQAAPVKRTPAKVPAAATPGSTNSARIEVLSRKRELTVDELVELRTLKGPS